MNKYNNSYLLRNWKSLREGIFYFPLPFNNDASMWVSKSFNAISFENHDSLSKLHKIWNNKFHYNYIPIRLTTTIMYPYMMIRKYLFKKRVIL